MRPRVIIAGGYGLVGGLAARRLRAAGLDIDLVLAGRHPSKGAALAAELGAEVLGLDVMSPSESLAAAGPFDLLVAALQDPGDALLTATLKAGAAHIGIVRTADSMATTAIAASALARRPALMLGHWQAGVLTMAALDAARHLARIDRIDLAALYDYADPIGPMTVADSGGFLGKALVRQQGLWVNLDAAASGRAVVRGAGLPDFEGQPMGVLDTPGLAAMTGARDVRFDLGAGQSLGSAAGGCASHDLYIDLRHDATYPFSNIYLFVDFTFPNGKTNRDTLACELADAQGNWLGSGPGHVLDHRIVWHDDARFPLQGPYSVRVVHAMREDPLQGVTDVGLRIEYAATNP